MRAYLFSAITAIAFAAFSSIAQALLITGGVGPVGGQIVQGIGNQCLEIPGAASTAPIAAVQGFNCWGGLNQVWIITNGQIQQINNGSYTCMEVANSSTSPGALVQLNNCSGAANQLWEINKHGEIVNLGSALCLDWGNAYTTNGVQLTVETCTAGSHQEFWLK
jgi:hypothetical protein